jgi:hypothetical protein
MDRVSSLCSSAWQLLCVSVVQQDRQLAGLCLRLRHGLQLQMLPQQPYLFSFAVRGNQAKRPVLSVLLLLLWQGGVLFPLGDRVRVLALRVWEEVVVVEAAEA